MMLLTQLREDQKLSRTRLGFKAEIHPARVGQTENRHVVPYHVELVRLAKALDYEGEPEDLLREVVG